MQIITIDDHKRFHSEKMQKNNLFETPNFFCDVYCLEPGQAQRKHAHEGADKVYMMLEGQGLFQVGGEEAILVQGQAVLAPAEVEHGVINNSDARLVALVFMAPNPNVA